MVKTVTITSLSSGLIGEPFVAHEVKLGIKRLQDMGLKVKFTQHALGGIEFLAAHPEMRADDLLTALQDEETDLILTAIGGDDTYRLLPYLFENDELKNAASDKLFLGFSDTTINHLMLHKVGMKTFYGQAFLCDICEMDKEMLPYTRAYFEELIRTGTIREIRPSRVWYDAREDFDPAQLGTAAPAHENGGFELLQGVPRFSGKILGGCVDTLYDIFDGTRYVDSPAACAKYELFPSAEDWKGRILLLETSEETPSPEKYRDALGKLRDAGVFSAVNGVLMGKPMNEVYSAEYKEIIREVVDDPALPIVANLSVGHATPRCIIPFGVEATVDTEEQVITFHN